MQKMSVRYKGYLDWNKNEDWYSYDERRKRFFLTEKVPYEARRSFELYKQINWRTYKDVIIDYERI